VLLKVFLAAFVFAHRAIHISYLTPPPPATASGPAWPFSLDRSWVLIPLGLAPGVTRTLGIALAAVTLAGFTVGAATVLGLLPPALWTAAAVIGASSSIALLGLFFHPWLVLGVAIDLALLAATLVARWTPEGLGS
jgi:hypothetical protein